MVLLFALKVIITALSSQYLIALFTNKKIVVVAEVLIIIIVWT